MGRSLSTSELGMPLGLPPSFGEGCRGFLLRGYSSQSPLSESPFKPAFTEELKHQLRGLDALSGEWSQYIKEAEPWVSYQFPSDSSFSVGALFVLFSLADSSGAGRGSGIAGYSYVANFLRRALISLFARWRRSE